jgi:hypothetical protein
MFFSVNDLYNYSRNNHDARSDIANFTTGNYNAPIRRSHVADYMRTIKQGILNRDFLINSSDPHRRRHIGKWYRPWLVVPELANFSAPAGDWGVGVEIELGFRSRPAAQQVAKFLSNWKHVALDYEGGTHPIEATFPPVLYSKFNSKSQPARYLKYLAANQHLVHDHSGSNYIGTHVNISKGGSRRDIISYPRLADLSQVMHGELTEGEKLKYFGRRVPYKYARTDDGSFIEFKMFNSSTNWKVLRRYVNVAVALADLAYSSDIIDVASVRAALDKGYNKRT